MENGRKTTNVWGGKKEESIKKRKVKKDKKETLIVKKYGNNKWKRMTIKTYGKPFIAFNTEKKKKQKKRNKNVLNKSY